MIYFGLGIAFLIVIVMAFLILLNQPKKNSTISIQSKNISLIEIKEKWQSAENVFSLGGPAHFKASIMEADKLVDSVLQYKMVPGKNMGERLKNAKKIFKDYNDYNNLWFAHKVRNNIAHEVSHELNSAEAKRAMEYYKKALRELGVI